MNQPEGLMGQLLTGYQCTAEYIDQQVPRYRDNPFTEALPPIYESDQVIELLTDLPEYDETQRQWGNTVRMHCIQQLKHFHQPMLFNVQLEDSISRVIRHGYTARNPLSATFNRQFAVGFKEILRSGLNGEGRNLTGMRPSAFGFSVVGLSGVGKSTAFERTLLLYPQVIQHTEYKGNPFIMKQLVWMKLECPANGSLKALQQNFFAQVDAVLGTSYFKQHVNQRSTAESLLGPMAQVAALHGLGVLVIDEIQRLQLAKSGGEEVMLNFLTELINTIGVPVILIGTYKSMFLFESAFAEARRAVGQPLDNVISNMEQDDEWNYFLESLWEFQWTKQTCPLTDELREVMYEESQGIKDIVVKLYMIAQWEAIYSGKEQITVGLIRHIAAEYLKFVRPMLQALKYGTFDKLKDYDDLKPSWVQMNDYIKKMEKKLILQGKLAKDHQRAMRQTSETDTLVELVNFAKGMNVPTKTAKKLAEKVIRDTKGTADITVLRQQLARLFLGMDSKDTDSPDPKVVPMPSGKRGARRRTSQVFENDDPWKAVFETLEKKGSVYEVMKAAGLIKPPSEFYDAK